MEKTIFSVSGNPLIVKIPDIPVPGSAEELSSLCDASAGALTALYQGELCMFRYGRLNGRIWTQVFRQDRMTDVTKEMLDGLYLILFEVMINGVWFPADRGGNGACLIMDPENRSGLHTGNDDHMWGGNITSVDLECIQGVRKYTSGSFLETFFDD